MNTGNGCFSYGQRHRRPPELSATVVRPPLGADAPQRSRAPTLIPVRFRLPVPPHRREPTSVETRLAIVRTKRPVMAVSEPSSFSKARIWVSVRGAKRLVLEDPGRQQNGCGRDRICSTRTRATGTSRQVAVGG